MKLGNFLRAIEKELSGNFFGIESDLVKVLVLIGLLIFGFWIYFLPSIKAFKRKHKNKVPILLVNIFFGWSLLGWVIALVWALMK